MSKKLSTSERFSRRFRFAVVSIWLVLLLAIIPTSVLAMDSPDSLSITSVYVYEGYAQEGDVGVLVEYFIDYPVVPNATVTETYLVIFLDTDGTTHITQVAPYAFNDNGYGHGVAWIYFSAAQATTYGLDVANKDLYTIRLIGNPLAPSGWSGALPSTTASIDYWQEGGDTAVLLALRILSCASTLETAWGEDMITSTAMGNRLTTLGEAYFTNVIPFCRTLAPNAFASSTISPGYENPDYKTEFGATLANGNGTVVGSPITIAPSGSATNVTTNVTVTVAGTFVLTLSNGTVGTVTNCTGTVTGSPVACVSGTNTLTVPAGGTGILTVNVYFHTTASKIWSQTEGTAFDLTALATAFHMSPTWLAGIVWFALTVLICAATYKRARENIPEGAGMGKIVFLMFNVCFIGGAVIGLLPLTWTILLFLGCDLFIGYIIFFRPASV